MFQSRTHLSSPCITLAAIEMTGKTYCRFVEHQTDGASAAGSLPPADNADRFALLNDLPVDAPSGDLLGIATAAEGIAEMLRASAEASPFVVAVDAAWGMGKSSLLQMVRAKLDPAVHAKHGEAKERSVRTVWFNAWTAEDGNALAELIKSVLSELDPNIVRRTLRQVMQRKRLMGVAGIGLLIAMRFFGVSRLVDELWARLYLDGQSRNKLRSEIAAMLEEWTSKSPGHVKRRIVVFIDDLDRCSEGVVVKVCEALKLYLDVPGLIFVLACDQSVLAQSVQDPSRDGLDEARSYLEKIVQVQYRLPAPDDEAVEALIDGYAKASGTSDLIKDEVRSTLAERGGRNPRSIKRIINSFILEYQLNPSWKNPPLSSYYLLMAILLQHLYTPFYDLLVRSEFDDPIADFLAYADFRDTLKAHQFSDQRDGPSPGLASIDDVLRETLKKYGIRPSEIEGPDPNRVISLLDARFPETFSRLVDNSGFVALMNRISGEIRDSFLRQLRFHPLVTESPQQLRPKKLLSGENCTVVMTDVVGYSRRNAVERKNVRTAFIMMLKRSFGGAWDSCLWSSPGDGLLIVVPPVIPTSTVMERLHRALPAELARHNYAYQAAARIRLRVAVDVGPVETDPIGLTGATIIRAARMVDAPALRDAINSDGTSLGIIVSDFVHDTVIRRVEDQDTLESYKPVEVSLKDTRITGWMQLLNAG